MFRSFMSGPARALGLSLAILIGFVPFCARAVTLAWDASADATVTGYTLSYGTTAGSHPTVLSVGNVLSAAVSNLTVGTTYYFVVTSHNAAGAESIPSNELAFNVPAGSGTNQPPTLNALNNVAWNEDAGPQTVALSGITDGSANGTQTLTVTATSSNPGLIPNPTVNYTSPNPTGTLTLTPAPNGNGTAVITVTVNDGQTVSNLVSRSFTVTINPVNDSPTLNALSNLALNTNSGLQTVTLSGISSGAANESQTLLVTATHDNAALLGPISVSYSSPSATGSLSFTPLSGASGSATVTVTVNDGGAANNLVTRTFTVTVAPTTTATLFVEAEFGTLTAPMQSVSDPNASNGRFVDSPTLGQGAVEFALDVPQTGDYTVWCRVLALNGSSDSFLVSADGGGLDIYDTVITPSSSWQWSRLNGRTNAATRIFHWTQGAHRLLFQCRESYAQLDCFFVTTDQTFDPSNAPQNQPPTLNPIADLALDEDAGPQTVALSGITDGSTNGIQALTVTAASSNPSLVPDPIVSYVSPNTTGTLTLLPAASGNGTAVITVIVSDGQTASNLVSRTFTVTVAPSTIATLFVEAEFGTLTSPMQMMADLTASNGRFVDSPTPGQGAVEFSLNVPQTGDYVVWCRVLALDAEKDSFSVSADGGALDIYDMVSVPSSSWQWSRLKGRTNGTPWLLHWSQGGHRLLFQCRESYAQLDCFYVTTDQTFDPSKLLLNQPPTLNPIANLILNQDDGPRSISLSGISAGSGEFQGLTVTAVSSNPGLIPNPVVMYLSPSTGGMLTFTPGPGTSGSATLSVTVNDGQSVSNTITRAFVVTVNPAPGPIVSGLVVVTRTARAVTLAWVTDVPGVCVVEFGPSSSLGSATPLETTLATIHQATISGLTPATTYYLRIRSAEAAGNTSYSGMGTMATPAVNVMAWAAEAGGLSGPVAIVTNATALDARAVVGSSNDTGLVSFPMAITVASDYQLWCRLRSPAAGVGSFFVTVDGAGEAIFDTAESGWTNGWQWVAVNARVGSVPLAVNPRLLHLDPGTPVIGFRPHEAGVILDELILSNDPTWAPWIGGGVPALTAVASATNRVDLSWTDPVPNEHGFQLEWSLDGIQFSALAMLPAGVTNYQHLSLAPATLVYYRIYAFTQTDRTEYSNVATARTAAATLTPAAPNGLTVALDTNGRIIVSWVDNSNNESGFTIERSTDGISFSVLGTVGPGVMSLVDSAPGHRHFYYRVSAFNDFGSSAPTSVVDIRK